MQVINTSDRAAVGQLITMSEYVDVIVPRGGKSLIERISNEARIPVIKHLDGNCHVFVEAQADLQKALPIALNAKTHRYGVCNAMETLLVDEASCRTIFTTYCRTVCRKTSGITRLPCNPKDFRYELSKLQQKKTGTPNI